ncbi:hypothetical protein ACP70R_013611 [Stipagrostis hirtigluma subsp. patula]
MDPAADSFRRSASNDALRLGSSSSSRSSTSSQQVAGGAALVGDLDAADGGAGLRSLIRRIKEYGVDQEALHDVMRNLVALSTHWLGSYAVEACIARCPTPVDRELVAATFAALRDHEVAHLVQDEYGSCVLQRFLQSAAKDDFMEVENEQARELARRIEQLPETVLEQAHAKKAVKAIRRMFIRQED